MSERNRNQKRRDKKGRILRNGESQRTDGRYAFVYTDCFGKQKFLYSWKLESTDPLPAGRRPCQSLREKEKAILKDIYDGITSYGDNLTVLELVKKYIGQKTGVRHNTEANYNFVINIIKNDEHYKRYYDGMFILFKTGLRISEFCGLTLSDIDFEEKQISVNHQLQRTRGMKYIIEDTKTSSGTRIIPMTEEVYECFKRIVENRKKPKKEPVIDGYKGFLFLDKKDMPEVALHWEKHFEWALAKHNRIYKEQLPKPHVCRHTYCSNMAKSGMNPKTLQYLMGHSDIGVTLNTYTHLGAEDAKEELGKYEKMA